MESERTVFTIGHSTIEPYKLVRKLLFHHIEVVVDVRSIPYSKYAPYYNKKQIRKLLRESGFDYRFGGKYLGAFPGGKRPPEGSTPDWAALASREEFRIGIRRVIELAQTQRVVLLCAEENPFRCHRHFLITPALMESGIRVVHIRHAKPDFLVTRIPGKRGSPFSAGTVHDQGRRQKPLFRVV